MKKQTRTELTVAKNHLVVTRGRGVGGGDNG